MLFKLATALLAVTLATTVHAQTQNEADAAPFLHLDKTYQTKCLPWISRPADGAYLYRSSAGFDPQSLRRLDLLSGACEDLAPLPSSTFNALAYSDRYLLAEDGIYNRISIYTKTDWKRHGTLRLATRIAYNDSAAIHGDRAYLFQDILDSTFDHTLAVTVFSLPDMKRIETRQLGRVSDPVEILDNRFLVRNYNTVTAYSFDGQILGHADLPYIPNEGPAAGCAVGFQTLNKDYALVTRSCTSYYVLNLKTFKVAYQLPLPKDVTYGRGFASGGRLYLFEDAPGQSPNSSATKHVQVQVFNLADGSPAGWGPQLDWDHSYLIYSVDDHLIWINETGSGAQVSIYSTQP